MMKRPIHILANNIINQYNKPTTKALVV